MTGAIVGIGETVVGALPEQSTMTLALADRDEKGLHETVLLTARLGGTASLHVLDVSDETAVNAFAQDVLREHGRERKHCFNVFLSHPHWDHIMGFPFFAPAYIPGNHIRVYGCHTMLREVLHTQQSAPFFPVRSRHLNAAAH